MAVEKLSDGIRKFAADAVKLERVLAVSAGGWRSGHSCGPLGVPPVPAAVWTQRGLTHLSRAPPPLAGPDVQRGEREVAGPRIRAGCGCASDCTSRVTSLSFLHWGQGRSWLLILCEILPHALKRSFLSELRFLAAGPPAPAWVGQTGGTAAGDLPEPFLCRLRPGPLGCAITPCCLRCGSLTRRAGQWRHLVGQPSTAAPAPLTWLSGMCP